MRDLGDLLRYTLRELALQSVEAALVGGLAVSIRTEPRFTRDIDLAVAARDDLESQSIVGELIARDWRVSALLEQETTARLAAVRLQPPGEGPAGRVVDLLFASSGIEGEIVMAAEQLEVLPGLHARVARIGHLMVLKLLARSDDRPQDSVDLRSLLDRADSAEIELARSAAQSVAERGFHRGRDLVAELESMVGGR